MARNLTPRIQMFATDIDAAALSIARAGTYNKEEIAGVSADRIERFFKQDGNDYRIDKSLRECIVFASHNLISDPPFSKLDLVVCRNLLIYLNQTVQKRVLSMFHYVLNSSGYLFLGSSESIGNMGRHFETISKQWRVFRHIKVAARRLPLMPIGSNVSARRFPNAEGLVAGQTLMSGQDGNYKQLLATYGHVQLLINAHNDLLFVSGDASPYLSVATGQASHNLFKMIKPELALSLRSAFDGVQKNKVRTVVSAFRVRPDGAHEQQGVRIEVAPLPSNEHHELFLICLSEETLDQSAFPMIGDSGNEWVLQQVLLELTSTQEDLRSTIEQSRISREEMKAANEEIMAMNEELQSANEELESSKEELQSLNEELITSNTCLDAKVIEVEGLNTDIGNFLNSADIATLLLDETLCIRRYTPACLRLFRVIPGDIGRSIKDVVRLFNDPVLDEDCSTILQGGNVADKEICGYDENWYLRRILPYRNTPGGLAGVVLSFSDITSLKRADQLLIERATALQWQTGLLSRAAPIVGRDLQDRIIFWNKGAEELYGWSEQAVLGKVTHDLLKTKFPIPLDQIRTELSENLVWKGELVHTTRDGGKVTVDSQWTYYRNEEGEVEAVVEVNNNISRRKFALAQLRDSETLFHTMVDWTFNWEYWVNKDYEVIYMTPSVETVTGYKVEEFSLNPSLFSTIIFQEDVKLWERHLHHIQELSRDECDLEIRIMRKNGEVRWVNHHCRAMFSQEDKPLGRRVTVRDITAQKQAEEQIHTLAYFDFLTRLPNRRLLMDRLAQLLIASKRTQQYGAVMMLDLDQFKDINDTEGHDAGDHLLIEVAGRIKSNVREEDTVARLGGDEFVVLLEGLGKSESDAINEAEHIAEKVRVALNVPYLVDSADFCSTASIGLTLFKGQTDSADVLLKQADVALYQAKDAGRNTVRFFNATMQAAIDTRTALEGALRRGLDKNEFQLYYQPQTDRDGHVTGAEALIRWFPISGMVSPTQFIPLMEQSGLILPVGQWVLDTACRQLKEWEDHPRYRALSISVNVSAKQFHQFDFVERVKKSLSESGANPANLKLELTESAILNNIDETVRRMGALIELGICFSLDDFGTGYSSLVYLKLLPIEQVKIDQGFIRDVTVDENDSAIVSAILAMSHALNIQTIAEGVETEEQKTFLLGHACDAFQGYLFGRPMSIVEWNQTIG
ncbi:MAG: EAL domain-containing protein [Gallionella sp.]|nr:EAL domain-containing protein [Gallionella sp.]